AKLLDEDGNLDDKVGKIGIGDVDSDVDGVDEREFDINNNLLISFIMGCIILCVTYFSSPKYFVTFSNGSRTNINCCKRSNSSELNINCSSCLPSFLASVS